MHALKAAMYLFLTLQASDAFNPLPTSSSSLPLVRGDRRAFLAGCISPFFASPCAAKDLAPVVVLGCDGQTGSRVTDILVAKGIPVRAVHHHLKEGALDVIRGIPVENVAGGIDSESDLARVVKGSSAVICVVGVQPKLQRGTVQEFDTGDPVSVFGLGYPALARQCVRHKVPRLVVLSSSCFYPSETCESLSRGEHALREVYSGADPSLGYAIVHAGRLLNSEARGEQEMELNQGGAKSGIVSRQDVAQLLVEAATDDASTIGRRVTFEAFYSDSAQPRDLRDAMQTCKENNVDLKDCLVGKRDPKGHIVVYPTNKERHAEGGWRNLFRGLEEDQGEPVDVTDFGVSTS